MYRRIVLLAVMLFSLGGCVPYSYADNYYRSEVYTSPAPAYYSGGGSYYRSGGTYYTQPRYYQPAPRYYQQPRYYRRRGIINRPRVITRAVAGTVTIADAGMATVVAVGTTTTGVAATTSATAVAATATAVATAGKYPQMNKRRIERRFFLLVEKSFR